MGSGTARIDPYFPQPWVARLGPSQRTSITTRPIGVGPQWRLDPSGAYLDSPLKRKNSRPDSATCARLNSPLQPGEEPHRHRRHEPYELTHRTHPSGSDLDSPLKRKNFRPDSAVFTRLNGPFQPIKGPHKHRCHEPYEGCCLRCVGRSDGTGAGHEMAPLPWPPQRLS